MLRVAVVLGLLWLELGTVLSKDIRGIQENITIENRYVIMDHQPLKNNTLTYAACEIPHERQYINCSVTLLSYPTATQTTRKACNVYRRASNNSYILHEFQLKLLNFDHVIFMWAERLNNEDEKNQARKMVYRTLHMSTCKSVENMIDYVAYSRPINVDDFYVVPYQDTFNLYFKYETLCNEMMCGLTQNKRGKIIHGPLPTYIPSNLFRYEAFEANVCPVKPITAGWGLFVLSKQFHLISSNAGEIKYLMDYPIGTQSQAFSCNNGYLGVCWLPSFYSSPFHNRNLLNCKQFDSQGIQTMDFTLAQENLNFDTYFALSNLMNGGMLLLTTSCTGHCQNKDGMIIDVYKIQNDNIKRIFRFPMTTPNYCSSFKDIKADIFEKDDGAVCWSITCKQISMEKIHTIFGVLSTCIKYTDFELNAENQDTICKKEGCLPKIFIPSLKSL